MRIAVIGAGISGLSVAWYLRHRHDVTVFEAANYVGGHTNTVRVDTDRGALPIDTGFIVYNERTYPNFCRLLAELQVASQPSDMSFSVRCDRTGLEYAGTGLNGLLAQRRNLLRPSFWRLLRDWRRFGREVQHLLQETPEESITVAEFFRQHPYSREFREQYFLPIGSAVWSCPHEKFEQFPMRFIIDFYHHHGLLTLADPPIWRVIRGGSQQYVRALLKRLPRLVETNAPVAAVRRSLDGVDVYLADGQRHTFDQVVLACHADQSLRLLGEQATALEREVLSAFPYEENIAVLHTDVSVLPRRRRAWASWNYHIPAQAASRATVTYNMNRLQNLDTPEVYCVTLNEPERIDPRHVIRSFTYHHPVFGRDRRQAQARHRELIDHHRISYCGAYWGNGFHEDGVTSALKVCEVLQPLAEQMETVR